MKINIYSIVKPSNDDFDKLIKEFIKMSSKYAKVEIFYIFNKDIAKAQTIGEKESKKIYTKSYLPYLKGYSIPDISDLLMNASMMHTKIEKILEWHHLFLRDYKTMSMSAAALQELVS